MASGESMKVCSVLGPSYSVYRQMRLVDYILFLTADVTVEPNLNEIRDHQYVDKAELQAMFDDPSEIHRCQPCFQY